MDDDPVTKVLSEAIEKSRGHAEFFDWPDKGVKEDGIVRTFIEELERDHGPLIADGSPLPGGYEHFAPDYQLITNAGEKWGVEVTELVSEEAIKLKKRGGNVLALWQDDELISKLHSIIAKKDKPKNLGGTPYDRYILLIHIDEDMVSVERLVSIMGSIDFVTALIDEIYVLVSYVPGLSRCPLLHYLTSKSGSPHAC